MNYYYRYYNAFQLYGTPQDQIFFSDLIACDEEATDRLANQSPHPWDRV
jgi:hypothetical protein